jgi:hypothetical protein
MTPGDGVVVDRVVDGGGGVGDDGDDAGDDVGRCSHGVGTVDILVAGPGTGSSWLIVVPVRVVGYLAAVC